MQVVPAADESVAAQGETDTLPEGAQVERSIAIERIALGATVLGIIAVSAGAGFFDWRAGLLTLGSLLIGLGLLLGLA